jgi:hypothetical protein
MPKRKPRYDYTWEEYLEIKKRNREILDRVLNTPNYQEIYGKKWYGDNWRATLYGNHPERTEMRKINTEKAARRKRGEDIPSRIPFKDRPVLQLDKHTDKVIKEWSSSVEVAKAWGKSINKAHEIAKVARNVGAKNSTMYGYKWKMKEGNYE